MAYYLPNTLSGSFADLISWLKSMEWSCTWADYDNFCESNDLDPAVTWDDLSCIMEQNEAYPEYICGCEDFIADLIAGKIPQVEAL